MTNECHKPLCSSLTLSNLVSANSIQVHTGSSYITVQAQIRHLNNSDQMKKHLGVLCHNVTIFKGKISENTVFSKILLQPAHIA